MALFGFRGSVYRKGCEKAGYIWMLEFGKEQKPKSTGPSNVTLQQKQRGKILGSRLCWAKSFISHRTLARHVDQEVSFTDHAIIIHSCTVVCNLKNMPYVMLGKLHFMKKFQVFASFVAKYWERNSFYNIFEILARIVNYVSRQGRKKAACTLWGR